MTRAGEIPSGGVARCEVIGDATLYLGDCLEVMPGLAPESVRLIWTDPPYGHNNADGDMLAKLNAGVFKGRKAVADGRGARSIANDGPDEMRRVVDGMLREAQRVMKKDASCCCCCCGVGGGPRPTFAWLANRMDEGGLSFFHSIIWDKKNPGLGWRYKRQHEMIMVAIREGGRLSWSPCSRPVGNVFCGFLPGQQRQHPNEKPLWLVEGFIDRHTEPGDMVLDPFMGGGTTGVASARMGRKFIGIEIDPGYFDIACRRIEQAARQGRLFDAAGEDGAQQQAEMFPAEGGET